MLLRALVLAGGFDSTCQPVFELTLSGDWAHLWLAALARGEGGPPAWLAYDNSGGQVFNGLCALPLFALLGESYLALNFLDATLRGDADAAARLDPSALGRVEELVYQRK